MANFFYPEIDPKTVKNLLVMQQLVAEHAAYFLDSPYSVAVETDLQALFKATRKSIHVSHETDEDDLDLDVEAELLSLFKNLKMSKPSMDDSEQMGYYRTSTALLEKILGLLEKARNIKTMSEHHSTIVQFMEEVCSPTQVEELLKRLKEATV